MAYNMKIQKRNTFCTHASAKLIVVLYCVKKINIVFVPEFHMGKYTVHIVNFMVILIISVSVKFHNLKMSAINRHTAFILIVML